MKREKDAGPRKSTFPWNSGLELKVWQVLKDEKFGLSSKQIAEKIQKNVSSYKVGSICHKHPFIIPVSKTRTYGRRWRAFREEEIENFFKKAQSLPGVNLKFRKQI